MKKIITTGAVSILFLLLFGGWGSTGHKIINSNVYICLPSQMGLPAAWNSFLAAHASDPDNRKNSDPTESPRHFIDIDAYPEFVANGFISQSYDSVVLKHTSSWVITQGTVPWAIIKWEDSLKNLFKQYNWAQAMQVAADLGHYVGDSHQPFHITEMYNTDLFGKSGIHSRYETTLVGQYQSNIVYTNDSASYVSDISDYVFNFLYYDYSFLRKAQYGDSIAQVTAGNTTSGTLYLSTYWGIAGADIITLMKNASKATADLIYTAWIDAGSPPQVPTSVNNNNGSPSSFSLSQNYPNPFNPSTTISYSIASKGNVTLKVYNVLGKEIAVLVNGEKEAGNYNINFNASALTSGVYFYELSSGGNLLTKKMIIMK